MTFGEKVRDLRKAKGLTQQALAELIGVTQGFVGHIEKGVRKGHDAALINRLCSVLNVPLDTFAPFISPGVTVPPPPPVEEPLLPFAGPVSCGPPGPGMSWAVAIEVPAEVAGPGRYVLQAEGNSMIDFGITPGTYVVIMPAAEAVNGQDVLVQVDGEFTLKRLVVRNRGDEREILLMGSGGLKPLRIRPGTDASILGIVTYSFRKHK